MRSQDCTNVQSGLVFEASICNMCTSEKKAFNWFDYCEFHTVCCFCGECSEGGNDVFFNHFRECFYKRFTNEFADEIWCEDCIHENCETAPSTFGGNKDKYISHCYHDLRDKGFFQFFYEYRCTKCDCVFHSEQTFRKHLRASCKKNRNKPKTNFTRKANVSSLRICLTKMEVESHIKRQSTCKGFHIKTANEDGIFKVFYVCDFCPKWKTQQKGYAINHVNNYHSQELTKNKTATTNTKTNEQNNNQIKSKTASKTQNDSKCSKSNKRTRKESIENGTGCGTDNCDNTNDGCDNSSNVEYLCDCGLCFDKGKLCDHSKNGFVCCNGEYCINGGDLSFHMTKDDIIYHCSDCNLNFCEKCIKSPKVEIDTSEEDCVDDEPPKKRRRIANKNNHNANNNRQKEDNKSECDDLPIITNRATNNNLKKAKSKSKNKNKNSNVNKNKNENKHESENKTPKKKAKTRTNSNKRNTRKQKKENKNCNTICLSYVRCTSITFRREKTKRRKKTKAESNRKTSMLKNETDSNAKTNTFDKHDSPALESTSIVATRDTKNKISKNEDNKEEEEDEHEDIDISGININSCKDNIDCGIIKRNIDFKNVDNLNRKMIDSTNINSEKGSNYNILNKPLHSINSIGNCSNFEINEINTKNNDKLDRGSSIGSAATSIDLNGSNSGSNDRFGEKGNQPVSPFITPFEDEGRADLNGLKDGGMNTSTEPKEMKIGSQNRQTMRIVPNINQNDNETPNENNNNTKLINTSKNGAHGGGNDDFMISDGIRNVVNPGAGQTRNKTKIQNNNNKDNKQHKSNTGKDFAKTNNNDELSSLSNSCFTSSCYSTSIHAVAASNLHNMLNGGDKGKRGVMNLNIDSKNGINGDGMMENDNSSVSDNINEMEGEKPYYVESGVDTRFGLSKTLSVRNKTILKENNMPSNISIGDGFDSNNVHTPQRKNVSCPPNPTAKGTLCLSNVRSVKRIDDSSVNSTLRNTDELPDLSHEERGELEETKKSMNGQKKEVFQMFGMYTKSTGSTNSCHLTDNGNNDQFSSMRRMHVAPTAKASGILNSIGSIVNGLTNEFNKNPNILINVVELLLYVLFGFLVFLFFVL